MAKLRIVQVIFSGAGAVAALALISTARPVDTATTGASGTAPAAAPFATDDTNFVNDQGQTSGDIFTQNALDQSTP